MHRYLIAIQSRFAFFSAPWLFVPRTLLGLALVWALLSFSFGADPSNPSWRSLRPSIDSSVLLGIFGAVALARRRIPPLVLALLVPLPLCAFALRIADGIEQEFFHRQFNVSLDFHLIREGVRLLHQTMPLSEFVVFCVGSLLGLAVVVGGLHWALRLAFSLMQRRVARRAYLACLLATPLLIADPLGSLPPFRAKTLQAAFNPSIVPRFADEVDFAIHAAGYVSEKATDMAAIQAKLDKLPSDLAKLKGATVHLFLIESFGYCAFERKTQFEQLKPALDRSQKLLQGAGFRIASHFLDSPTYGAGSQFAQLTLGTGIRVTDNFQYRLVMSMNAHTLPRFFKAAGYRTVFAMPGTRRDWPAGSFWGFDKLYDRWDFDYAGPVLGWGELPDQYTIDALHRNELGDGHGPVFAEYALITSHGPWATVPFYVKDWERIKDGKIYGRVRSKRFRGLKWSNLKKAPQAYIETIEYDFKVLTDYMLKYVDDDALVIALGDHQPVVGVSGRGRPHSVPIHVFSKRPELVEEFEKRGYIPGLVPNQPLPHQGLKSFLPMFLEAFSTPKGGTLESTQAKAVPSVEATTATPPAKRTPSNKNSPPAPSGTQRAILPAGGQP